MMEDEATGLISSGEMRLLNDISSIGAKGAALVLSKMLGIDIEVQFEGIAFGRLEEALNADVLHGELVSFVFSKFHGDINGTAAIFFSEQSTMEILKALYNRSVQSLIEMEEIDFSIIKETGNIIICSFLTALCNTYEMTALPTVPDVAVDNFDAIVDSFTLILYENNQ
ncbi:chemotaxis protein CheC, partial [bacterium]|nr:chemotaxis protein CheC [bacterium]